MKRRISLLLVFVMVLGILSGCRRPGEEASKLSSTEQARVAANNMQNSSHFATDGKYLYCSDWDDGIESFNKIIKVNMDDFSIVSTYETTMSYGEAFWPHNLVCVNDTLYYYNWMLDVLFSLDTEMTESMELPFSEYFNYFQTDGEYYYVADYMFFGEPGIFRVAISDINKDTKNDKTVFTKISDLYASNLIMQGDYLYFYSSEFILNGETLSEYGWWRIDLDGSNPIKISENRPRYFIVEEDRVYFVEEEDCIYSMNLDGSDRKVLAEAYIDADLSVTSINTAGGYIFYRYAEDGTLHRVNTDGTNDIQLNDCDTTNIVIAGDWVIYENEDDWNYYKMHFDGSNHGLISEVPTDEEPTEAIETIELPTEVPETTPVNTGKGDYTLEECQNGNDPAMYVRYSDGSFDKVYNGAVLNWGDYSPMTYGADYFDYHDLIIKSTADDLNPTINATNQLVLFCSIEGRVFYDIYAVEASGTTVSRTNEDGKWEAVFFSNDETNGSLYCSKYWRIGKSIRSTYQAGFDCTYINGESIGDYPGIPLAEGTDYCDVPEWDTFMLGVVEGTTLVEKEFTANARYYIQSETGYEFKMTPTVDGYAIIDFSDIPAGEYIVQISWWDDGRSVWTTHITVE